MRPSSRTLVPGILILAVLALPASGLAQDAHQPPRPAASALSELALFLRAWLPSWLTGGVVKPSAWQANVSEGYAREWGEAGSSMDPNGTASTTPVLPPRQEVPLS